LIKETDFWSRRKAGVEAEAQVAVQAQQAEEAAVLAADQAEKTDIELLEELGLPDPDNMMMGDDFSAFMSKAVPDRLRRRALRRLWLANPALANLDGLLDYGEDFTDSATVIENMQTAYQVGKGMTEHVLEMVRQAEEEAARVAQDQASLEDVKNDLNVSSDAPKETHEDALVEGAAEDVDTDTDTDTDTLAAMDEQAGPRELWSEVDFSDGIVPDPAALPKRRMTFQFEQSRDPEL
jgi:hypothetical protein